MGETAVIVNELGEVAIDHHLLRRVDERTVVLGNGCVCCSLRGDLADELRDLLGRRDRGEIPAFRRVVVETTGLADPAPIVYTLLSEPVVKHHFELEMRDRDRRRVHGLPAPESVKQAAAADRLVVTKTDLERGRACSAGSSPRSIRRPKSSRRRSAKSTPERLFGGRRPTPARRAARDEARPRAARRRRRAHSLVFDEPLDWTAFGVWLTMLLASRGGDVLRVKGLLDVGGPAPLLLNGVQHVVHPPVHLDAWPDDDRRSRIVFIGRDLERRQLEESLTAFMRAARH